MNGNMPVCFGQEQPKKWTIRLFFSSILQGGGLQWFAVVCGGLPASSLVTLPIVPNDGGDLWWFAVMCGGLWWFAVVCGGLRWFAMVCGGLSFTSFSHTDIPPNPIYYSIYCLRLLAVAQ